MMRNKNTKRRKKQTEKESEKRSQSPFFVFGVTLTFLWSTHKKKKNPDRWGRIIVWRGYHFLRGYQTIEKLSLLSMCSSRHPWISLSLTHSLFFFSLSSFHFLMTLSTFLTLHSTLVLCGWIDEMKSPLMRRNL